MKKRYYILVNHNRFAEQFVARIQQKLQERGSPISVCLAAVNLKLHGCRIFEIPSDRLYTKADDINKVGEMVLQYLDESGWIQEISYVIEKDCKRLKCKKLEINFLLTNRCEYIRAPGFIFYWRVRSKKV
ncbi:hypothetical protein AALB53_13985 [Lachnospiraceae bacterium 47-T17]